MESGGIAAPLTGMVAIGAALWGMTVLQEGVVEGIRDWQMQVLCLWHGMDVACPYWSDRLPMLGAAIPLFTAGLLAICSLILRVPLVAGLVRGFRGAALPLACLLVLVYAGCLLVTAGHDQAVQEQTPSLRVQEGPVLAARAGLEWPGRVEVAPERPESP